MATSTNGDIRDDLASLRRKLRRELAARGRDAPPASTKKLLKQLDGVVSDLAECHHRLLEMTPEGLLIAGPDDRVLEANSALAAMLGVDAARLAGRPVHRVLAATRRRVLDARLSAARGNGERVEWETQLKPRLGPPRDVLVSVVRATDNGDGRLLCAVRDVTFRRRVRDAIQETELRFRAIFDNAFAFIGLCSPDGRLLEVNRTALAFRGLERQEVAGVLIWNSPWLKAASPATRRRMRESFEQAARGELVRYELTLPDAAGADHVLDFSLKPVRDAAGRVTLVIPEGRDITERKLVERALGESRRSLEEARAELEQRVARRTAELTESNRLLNEVIARRERVEQSLRESEAQTRAILDTAVDAIITIDERGEVLSFNRAAERLFGYAADEVIGKNVSSLMPEPYAGEHDGYLSRYVRTGVRHIIGIGREATGKRKDGTLFPLDLAVSEVKLGHRRTFTGVVRDLTDRKRLEREILEAAEREQKRIGQDLHDGLGQQLTGIGFLTQTLEHQLNQLNHPAAEDAARITALVGEAIQQARGLAHGLYPVEPQPGGLDHALRLLCQSVTHAYKVRCRFRSGKLPGFDDRSAPTHLYRIAQEAVNNAVRHGKATEIAISLTADRSGIALKVRDNGRGLKEGASDSGAPVGGIGLRTMRHRAHLIGGVLTIKPRKPGVEVLCRLPKKRSVG